MGNFQTFLSSDCFSEKYQEIVKDVKAIEEKFEKLNSSNALKLQYKNLFDNLLVKLENPQYIDVDETMTYIRKILKKLKVYDESDISDIETAIKNLSVKVSLFLYDDDNNDRRIYLNLLKKRELQLINACITLIDYHTKQNYNNLDPLYKSLRKTSLGSKILQKKNRNLHLRENIPILSNIIENINVQSLDSSLVSAVPKTSAREKVNRADRNISNAKIDIDHLVQEEDDEIPVKYQTDNAQELLKRKINKLKHDVDDHTVENPLQPPTLSKPMKDLDNPASSNPNLSISSSHMKPPRLTDHSVSMADNISQLSEDDSSTLYASRHPLKNLRVGRADVSQKSKTGFKYNEPFYDTQQMEDRRALEMDDTLSQRAVKMDDTMSRQSSMLDDTLSRQSSMLDDTLSRQSSMLDDTLSRQSSMLDDTLSRQSSVKDDMLSQRTKRIDSPKYKDEDGNNFRRRLPKANFYDGDQISRDQSQQTQVNDYQKKPHNSKNQQANNDLIRINQLRKRLEDAQKTLTEENRRNKKNRNLFKKQVRTSTDNVLQSKKIGKKMTPTLKKFLSSIQNNV